MDINELARQSTKLLEMYFVGSLEDAGLFLDKIIFCFENDFFFSLNVDIDSDELIWSREVRLPPDAIAMTNVYPAISKIYGMPLMMSWNMINHQGYFDAVQIELYEKVAKRSHIFQFEVAASNITIYEVNPMGMMKN